MNCSQIPLSNKQRGAALLTALVMLVLLTMLGLTSMTTTTLDERMAANSQEINRAFQAAESGLQLALDDSDAFLTANTDSNPFTNTASNIGGTGGPNSSFKSVYIQQTTPPRGAGWDSTMAFYHFQLSSTGSTNSGATTTVVGGAYQVGRKSN